MVTSTTVGYGDISPLSVSAVWIVIVHHLASIILLIAVVTQLASFSGTRVLTCPPERQEDAVEILTRVICV